MATVQKLSPIVSVTKISADKNIKQTFSSSFFRFILLRKYSITSSLFPSTKKGSDQQKIKKKLRNNSNLHSIFAFDIQQSRYFQFEMDEIGAKPIEMTLHQEQTFSTSRNFDNRRRLVIYHSLKSKNILYIAFALSNVNSIT